MKIQYVLAATAFAGVILLLVGRRHRWLRISGAVVLVFLAGFLSGYFTYRPYTSYAWRRHFSRLEARFLNKPAPEVSTTTFDGTSWRLKAERGRVVVLDFWASWCAPCERTLPALKALQAKYGSRDDFRIVGIALDEDCSAAASAANDKAMTWMNTCEGKMFDSPVARAFDVTSLPSLWIVDREGRIQGVRVSENRLDEHVARVLGITAPLTPAVGEFVRPSNYRLNPPTFASRRLQPQAPRRSARGLAVR